MTVIDVGPFHAPPSSRQEHLTNPGLNLRPELHARGSSSCYIGHQKKTTVPGSRSCSDSPDTTIATNSLDFPLVNLLHTAFRILRCIWRTPSQKVLQCLISHSRPQKAPRLCSLEQNYTPGDRLNLTPLSMSFSRSRCSEKLGSENKILLHPSLNSPVSPFFLSDHDLLFPNNIQDARYGLVCFLLFFSASTFRIDCSSFYC